ncbi:class I SAM-dependent methyltransferase [Streptomyces sp. B6B3]|uniref:class I SAM-dependent methyltransferase n=1 Tax=Streptomyces sp. B6B3 TaxID=3153570 RepID=UPI00325CA213
MAEKRVPGLGGVQETLLVPLWARAVETRKRRGVLSDPRAVELVEALDYDFSPFDDPKVVLGSNLRTLVFDAWVRRFLDEHPGGTVVEIGAGLNTRFERLDNGTVHWFDLDLPDVMELRRAFFDDTSRRHGIAASVTDASWVERVRRSPGPYFLAAEAVLFYLEEPAVRGVFGRVAERLPGVLLAADTASGLGLDTEGRQDVMSRAAARMRWHCADPRTVERWGAGIELLDSRTLAGLPTAVRRRLPLRHRAMLRVASALYRRRLAAYRFNLFRIGTR